MTRRLLTVLALFGLLIGTLVSTAGSVAADTKYTCPDSSCSFSVPANYSKLMSDGTSITFQDANTGGTFTVALLDAPTSGAAGDAAQTIVTQLATLDSFTPDPAGPQTETVGGNPATSLVYTYNANGGAAAKAKAFFTVYNGKLYLLQFATTADQEDAFVKGAQGVFDTWMFM